MPRYFTLAEANETLIIIKPMIAEIMTIRQAILNRQPEVWLVIQKIFLQLAIPLCQRCSTDPVKASVDSFVSPTETKCHLGLLECQHLYQQSQGNDLAVHIFPFEAFFLFFWFL